MIAMCRIGGAARSSQCSSKACGVNGVNGEAYSAGVSGRTCDSSTEMTGLAATMPALVSVATVVSKKPVVKSAIGEACHDVSMKVLVAMVH